MIRIKINSLIWVVVLLIVTFVSNHFIDVFYEVDHGLVGISILLIINLLIQLMAIKSTNHRIISFFTAFIVFMHLFHFGQVFTAAYYPNVDFDGVNYILVYMRDEDCVRRTIKISLNCINYFLIGGLLSDRNYTNHGLENTAESDKGLCYLYGMVLLLISTPLRIYTDVRSLIITSYWGYAETGAMGGSLPGVLTTIAGFWYVAVPLLYIGWGDRKHKKLFFALNIIYIVITMFSGGRGHQVISIISLMIVIFVKDDVKLSINKIIKYTVLGVIMLNFIDLIFDVRHVGFAYFISHLGSMLSDVFVKNIFVESLHDFGATIYTPYIVVEGLGTRYTPFFGETFIKSLIQIFPTVGNTMKTISNASILGRALDSSHRIGGSFAAEMYYDFGWAYPIASVIIGYICGKFSISINQSLKSKKEYPICCYLPFMIYSLWWVRDTIGNITRGVVWLFFILLICKYSVTHRKNQRSMISD